MLAIEGLEIVVGVSPRDFGTKLVMTVPKETSTWIDSRSDRWDKLVLARKAATAGGRKMWPGCTGTVGLDFAGESDPVEAHFHLTLYLFPAAYLDMEWCELDT